MKEYSKQNYFIQDWMNTVSETVKLIYPDIPDLELEEFLYEVLDNNINIPIATLDNNYNKSAKEVDVLSLMQWVKDNKFIIAGNGTIFKNHNQEYNPAIHFLIDVKNSRDSIKKSMKKKTPGTYEYLLDDMGQLNEKLLMNSEYGAAGSDITYFYNLYCAVSTTASGQSLISTAMCCFENFFSDNVKFIDFDDCSKYITNIKNEPLNEELVTIVDDKKVPEVFDRLKNKFMDYKEDYTFLLFSMLRNLDQDTLNKLYYKNNLYGFVKLPKVKKLIFKIIDETDLFLDPNKPPQEAKEDLELLWYWTNEWVMYNHFAFNRIGRLTCDERDTVVTID